MSQQWTPDPAGIRLKPFPIWLVPGLNTINVLAFVVVAYTTIGLLTFVAIGTPYVLTTNLGIPQADQGRIVGDFQFLNEITMILVFAPAGILADRIGRREVYVVGLLAMALGYFLYPLAGSIPELSLYRVIYAVGIGLATGMLGTLVADYPQEISRGRLIALAGILNAIGVISVALGMSKVPSLFTAAGYDAVTAGRYTHWIIAGLCLFSGLVAHFGLKRGTPGEKHQRPPVRELIVSGLVEAKNPRIALAYAAGFVARSDLVVLGTFTVLWGTTAAMNSGMGPAEAAGMGGRLFGTASVAALLWLPVCGILMDRVNRVTGSIVCMLLATIGYLCMFFVDDVLSPSALGWFGLLGVGQISAFFAATTLIGQEAPRLKRGTVVGAFNMCGAVGILIAVAAGGRLFDAVSPAAPFIMIGFANAVVLLLSVVVRIKDPGPMVEARQPA